MKNVTILSVEHLKSQEEKITNQFCKINFCTTTVQMVLLIENKIRTQSCIF